MRLKRRKYAEEELRKNYFKFNVLKGRIKIKIYTSVIVFINYSFPYVQ